MRNPSNDSDWIWTESNIQTPNPVLSPIISMPVFLFNDPFYISVNDFVQNIEVNIIWKFNTETVKSVTYKIIILHLKINYVSTSMKKGEGIRFLPKFGVWTSVQFTIDYEIYSNALIDIKIVSMIKYWHFNIWITFWMRLLSNFK